MQPPPIKGRGSVSNKTSRFDQLQRVSFDDEWAIDDDQVSAKPATTVFMETAKSIISRNDSADTPFDQSINPYRVITPEH